MAKYEPQAELPLVDQVRVRHEKLQALQQEGRDPFQITKYDVTHHAQEVKDRFDELEEQSVRLAGRIMSKRGMGVRCIHHTVTALPMFLLSSHSRTPFAYP